MSAPKLLLGKFLYSHLSLFSLTVVILVSCRKIDHISLREKPIVTTESRFFEDHTPQDTLVKSILGFVKRENEKHQFVNKLIKKIGYPYWDKALVVRGSHGSNGRGHSDSTNTILFRLYWIVQIL